jgi:hypothetical protein
VPKAPFLFLSGPSENVTTLVAEREIKTLRLVVFLDAQPHDHIDQLQQQEADRTCVNERSNDPDCLGNDLVANAFVTIAEARPTKLGRAKNAHTQRADDATNGVDTKDIE